MLKKLSYQYRLYISFAVIILIILIVSGYFFYQYNASLLKENIESNTFESLNLIGMRIDDRITEMDNIVKKLHASSEFTDLAFSIPYGDGNYFIREPRKKTQMNQMFLSALASEALSTSIHYVSIYYDYTDFYITTYPNNIRRLSKNELMANENIKKGLTTEAYQLFIPPHPDYWMDKEPVVFSVIRPIRDNFQTYGILEINQGIAELDELSSLSDMTDSYEVIILDEYNNFVYSSIGQRDGAEFREKIDMNWKFKDKGSYYLDKDTLLCYQHSDLTGWTIFMKRNMLGYKQSIKGLRKMIFLVYAIGFFVILLFIFILTRSLTKPLIQLKEDLLNFDVGQKIKIDVQSNHNEISLLAIAIKEILNRIKQQNLLLMQTRKRAMKAHFDALQAQLNPHFLYNTLSVIGACGMEDGSKRISKMCSELANLLRYSVRYENKLVSLGDEIKNIENYLYIMKMRYEDMVVIEWQIEKNEKPIKVPKLILQPLVENSFKHGFKNQPPIWKIKIVVKYMDNKWYVSIANTGNGFPEYVTERINLRIKSFKENFPGDEKELDMKGLGLENTLKRLYLHYGEDFYFDISKENDMTVVTVGGIIYE